MPLGARHAGQAATGSSATEDGGPTTHCMGLDSIRVPAGNQGTPNRWQPPPTPIPAHINSPGVSCRQVCPRPQQRLQRRSAAAHRRPVERALPRAVGGVDIAATVQEVSEDRYPVVQRRPLQGEEALLVWTVQCIWVSLRQLSQLLKVAIGRGLPDWAAVRRGGEAAGRRRWRRWRRLIWGRPLLRRSDRSAMLCRSERWRQHRNTRRSRAA